MFKNIKREKLMKALRSTSLGLILLSVLILPIYILACGMAIVPINDGWGPGDDSAEQSFIDYNNGVEKLIISRNFSGDASGTVWIIPVPAKASSAKLDVLSNSISFAGKDVQAQAQSLLSDIRDHLLETQIYPYPVVAFIHSIMNVSIGGTLPAIGLPNSSDNSGVDVEQHIEKNGMVAEAISADNSQAIYEYLNKKGLNVQKDSIPILQDYIGKGFSFVASWVDPSSSDENPHGIMMTFPTEKIFYPLKPESLTKGYGLPETINIVGFVTPKLFANIKDNTRIDYYSHAHSTEYTEAGEAVNNPFPGKIGFNYTKVVIYVEPSMLTQDLYFSSSAPIRISIASFLADYAEPYQVWFEILAFIIISSVATRITSKILLRSVVEPKSNLWKLYIFNWFTLIGTIVGANSVLIKEKRNKFIILYTFIFIVLVLVAFNFLIHSYVPRIY